MPGADRPPAGAHRDRAGEEGQRGVGPERRGQLGLPHPVGEQDAHPRAAPPVAGAEQRHRVGGRRPGAPDRRRPARRVGRPPHRPRRPRRRGRAERPLDDPQGAVHPGQDPGGRDQVAVVDVADPVLPAHRRVLPAQPDQAQPVRGRGAAVEQAGPGQHLGAGAHAYQQRGAPRALPLEPLDDRGGARPARAGQLRDHDRVGGRGQPAVQLPERAVGDEVQAAGERHRLAPRGGGVDVEPPGAGQHLVRGEHVRGVRPLRAEDDHRRGLRRVVRGRRGGGGRDGRRAAAAGRVGHPCRPRGPGRARRGRHRHRHGHHRRHPAGRPPSHRRAPPSRLARAYPGGG